MYVSLDKSITIHIVTTFRIMTPRPQNATTYYHQAKTHSTICDSEWWSVPCNHHYLETQPIV